MEQTVNKKSFLNKSTIGWIVTILAPILIMTLVPLNNVMTQDLKIFLAVTLTAICCFVFEQVNTTVVALALPVAYVFILQAPAEVVYQPWSMSILWMLIGGFLLANIMQRVGLLHRIAYKCILLTGASYKGIIWGIAIAGVAIFLIMPNDNAAVPIAALAFGICASLKLKQSPESAGIMFAAALAAMLPGCFLFNTGIFMMFGLGESATGPLTIGWLEYLWRCWPNALYYFFLFFLITKMFGKGVELNGKEYFQSEYKKLGKMSRDEKRVLIDVLILMIFIFTNKIHHIDVLWGFAVIPLLMFLPGLKVADGDDLKNVNWTMVIFAAGCLSIGTVAGAMGFGEAISQAIVPLLQGKSFIFVLLCVYIGYFILNFVMTPMAVNVTFALPLAQIAVGIGLNPMAIYMIMGNASDQILLPYEVVLWLVYFSFGMISMRDFIKFMGTKALVNLIFVFCVLVPWWNFTGFLSL
ncbi:MAG: SLC13 family permease [Peptococcaceae bacterium]|nr:SLC13 family permease [Peptococcaceae bacterium]